MQVVGRWSRLRASGTVILTPVDGGPPVQIDAIQCSHCGRHFITSTIGPNDRRRLEAMGIRFGLMRPIRDPGRCTVCARPICDEPSCQDHVVSALNGTIHSPDG